MHPFFEKMSEWSIEWSFWKLQIKTRHLLNYTFCFHNNTKVTMKIKCKRKTLISNCAVPQITFFG